MAVKKANRKKSLKAKILGFIILYFLLALFSQKFLGLHSPLFDEKASVIRARQNISVLVEIVSKNPPLPIDATHLRNKLIEMKKTTPDLVNKIPKMFYSRNLIDAYILDLKDFAPITSEILYSRDTIRVKECKNTKILYAYFPRENTARFYLCDNNRVDLRRTRSCC